MPDIAAARPTGGAPIELAWGQQVHDAIENGGVLARTEWYAPVPVTATAEASANPVVTCPAITLTAAAVLEAEFTIGAIIMPNLANATLIVLLFENGLPVGRLGAMQPGAAGNWIWNGGSMKGRLSRGPGTYTYSVRATVSAGNASMYSSAAPGPGGVFSWRAGNSRRLAMLRDVLARLLPRWLAVALGIRRLTPAGSYWPTHSVHVEPIDSDTGGGFRAAWRMQDPAKDPKEPYGSELSGAGNDHGWSNCTMASAALAIAYQQPRGSLAPYGGDMRHRQSDLSGGTDLYDAQRAWSAYGETLTIKSGGGWSAVKTAHNEGRAVVIQGTGNVPGSESFDGGHACAIAPETHSDGRWLFGDPLADGWQWIEPGAIETWAERWQSSVAFAVGEKPPAPPPTQPPPPEPEPCPDCPPPPDPSQAIAQAVAAAIVADDDADVAEWIAWLHAGQPTPADVFDLGAWSPAPASLAVLTADCADLDGAHWQRGPLPDPVASAYAALTVPATWNGTDWRGGLWRDDAAL